MDNRTILAIIDGLFLPAPEVLRSILHISDIT